MRGTPSELTIAGNRNAAAAPRRAGCAFSLPHNAPEPAMAQVSARSFFSCQPIRSSPPSLAPVERRKWRKPRGGWASQARTDPKPPSRHYRSMTYKECCGRLSEKLSESGPLVGAEALALLEQCVDALRADSADGNLAEAALVEHLPKLRTVIRTVWSHDKEVALSLENRIIAILAEEKSRSDEIAAQSSAGVRESVG